MDTLATSFAVIFITIIVICLSVEIYKLITNKH